MEEVPKIKKSFDWYLYYLAIPAFIIFLLINYYSQIFKIEGLDVGFAMSIVSFLFGFLVTITFSMMLGRVGNLKNALAAEAGRLTSLYQMSRHLGKEFSEKIRERIDNYSIQTLKDYSNYENSRNQFYGIYEDLKYMEVKNPNQEQIANSFMYVLGEFSITRENLEYLTNGEVLKSIKLSNYFLGGILIILLFLNRSNFFTDMLFVFLSSIIVLILLIIEDYDDLRIHDYQINISNSEEIFDMIGKPRYYPVSVLGKVKLKTNGAYRIGIYNRRTGEEKVYNLQYTGAKKLRLGSLTRRFYKGRR